MKKKFSFRKRLCCSVAAILSLFAVCGHHLYAANNASQGVQEAKAGVTAPNFTPAAMDGLEGAWRIDQVKVKKTVNGASSENTYSLKLKQKIESFADCPKKMTFTADGKVIFEYNDKAPSEGSYKVEGNQILRKTPVAGYEYEFVFTDTNKIQLLYSIDYVRNSGNNVDQITEEYTYFGTKE